MLKRSAAAFALIALTCLAAMASSLSQSARQEDATVLQAALISLCQEQHGYVVLSSTTIAPRAQDDMGDADESGAFSDLKRRNGSAALLPDVLACGGTKLLPEQQIQRFFKQKLSSANQASLDDAWKKFYESFPGATGWTSVSRPGYSPDGTIAVVYMAHYCGTLCGGGSYVYLRRVKDKWTVLVTFPGWVS